MDPDVYLTSTIMTNKTVLLLHSQQESHGMHHIQKIKSIDDRKGTSRTAF